MTAKIRLAIAALVTGLALGPVAALAQDAPPADVPATTNQPATGQPIGPRELQDFNLPGTVTRPAEPPPRPTVVKPQPAPRPALSPAIPAARTPPAEKPAKIASDAANARAPDSRAVDRGARADAPVTRPSRPSSSVTMHLPPVGDSPSDSAALGAPAPAASPAPITTGSDVPLPWLVAAAMLLVGAAAYFWRNRQRHALAGEDDYDSVDAPPPAGATPRPPAAAALRPAPAVDPDPEMGGLVSTRLRPWLEIGFQPTRCGIDDEQVTFEFEFGLFNSGTTPAREILVEASYFNAGENQDGEIEQFFANPVGEGGRAVSLAPLKRMIISSKVMTPRANIREFEVGGRKVFVPLIGFNALYRWATGEGQTSASFILGRKTGGEKLAPFRLDMIDREFRALDKRPLPAALRH